MCGGGGGGGGGPPPSDLVSYTDALGETQNVNQSDFGQTMGLNPLSAGTAWQKILADPSQAAKYQGMGKSQDMLYPGGVRPDQATQESFLGTRAVGRMDNRTPDRRSGIASQFAGSTEGNPMVQLRFKILPKKHLVVKLELVKKVLEDGHYYQVKEHWKKI